MFANENAYDDIVRSVSEAHGVPVALIKAVVATESSFKERSYRYEPKKGEASYGLMQLLHSTAVWLGFPRNADPTGLYDPSVNLDLGAKYLAWILKRQSDPSAVYAVYNAGKVRDTDGDLVLDNQTHVDRFNRYFEYFMGKHPVPDSVSRAYYGEDGFVKEDVALGLSAVTLIGALVFLWMKR